MGILFSNGYESMRKAHFIRQDLYHRINSRKQKYSQIFETVPLQKKKKILRSDATQLANLMDSGQATSVEILMCFIERTISVGVKNNYVIDEMFEQALIKAMECDIMRKEKPERKSWKYGMDYTEECWPPFFGVPCSVKETILMKGKQSYCGFVSCVNPIPNEDSAYVILIQRMGFIPFVRSNVPQACKTIQTNNNMFGYCLNYRNSLRTCGGSSGGEGGMVGSFCSPFGIGSDIGGSLRVPAEFNGLFTLKVSGRNERNCNAYYGKYAGGCTVKAEPGPLTRSVRDIVTYCEFMFNEQNYARINKKKIDPHLTLTPLDHSIFQLKSRLKIGIIPRLDTLKCSPSHQNALQIVSHTLKSLGHSVVTTSLPKYEQLYFFMIRLFTCANSMKVLQEIRQNQSLIKQYKMFDIWSRIPWLVKKVIIWLIRKKQPRLVRILELAKPINAQQIIQMIYDIQVRKAQEILKFFVDNKFDALIMPGFATPAPRIGQVGNLQYCLAFQSGWNVVQYPVGNMPIKLVETHEAKNFSDQFSDTVTKNMKNNIKGSEGMPVGVQIISLPKNEQKILYIMSQLQSQLKFNETYPLEI